VVVANAEVLPGAALAKMDGALLLLRVPVMHLVSLRSVSHCIAL
jgi:hypothetical protein